MYVVDMYRGVVQEADLLDRLPARLHQGRAISSSRSSTGASGGSCTIRPSAIAQPALSKATPAELVQTLSHPNGWWRDTAQQLLVERDATAGRAPLTKLAGADVRLARQASRVVDARRTRRARAGARAHVARPTSRQTSAPPRIRLSERWLREGEQPRPRPPCSSSRTTRRWTVRRQLGASHRRSCRRLRGLEPSSRCLHGTAAIRCSSTRRSAACAAAEADVLDRVLQASADCGAGRRRHDARRRRLPRAADVPSVQRMIARAATRIDAGVAAQRHAAGARHRSAVSRRRTRWARRPRRGAAGAAGLASRRARGAHPSLPRPTTKPEPLAKRVVGKTRLAGEAGAGCRRRRAADRRAAAAIRCRRRALQEHLRRLPSAGRQGQGKDRAKPAWSRAT